MHTAAKLLAPNFMDYYIAPAFLDKLAVHITKNFLDLPGVKVPLILGIHGRKGEGKTFQCELVFDRMKVAAIHISAGELESPDAGDSARLIRLRYREAAEIIKVRGRMAVLVINDIDAGAGRFDQGTQYTVNTQLVNATLMNIADNPTNVQLPGSYDSTPLPRIPIILTGNDLSTLYAPLVRDGRMEKFYWVPTRDDKIGIVSGVFAPDNISQREIVSLVDRFPEQAVDFLQQCGRAFMMNKLETLSTKSAWKDSRSKSSILLVGSNQLSLSPILRSIDWLSLVIYWFRSKSRCGQQISPKNTIASRYGGHI